MRLRVCAVGRLRKGPERALVDDYLARFDRTGRALSLGPCTEVEIDERRNPTPAQQAAQLARALPSGAHIMALDERGSAEGSRAFAARLARLRDDGRAELAFVIGGADGLDADLRGRADTVLTLSPMVWPHMLARVMLAEQLYRAATILAGSPYHRD